MESDIDQELEEENVRRHPRVEDLMGTLKVLVKNKVAMTGLIITAAYFVIALIDAVYPQYLGINPGTSLSDALTAFHRTGLTWLGKGYITGVSYGVPPYGSIVSVATIVPPTLHGPTGTPGWWWWLGGTQYNLPLFPLILGALKFDIAYTIVIVISGAVIGTVVGTISGYYGGVLDEVLMRVVDIFFSIPFLVLTMALIYVLGTKLIFVIIALVIVWWPTYARLTRGQALSIKSNKFVEASTASGSSNIRTVFSHIMPNVLAPVFVQISLDFGVVVQIFATLWFIGFRFSNAQYMAELGNVLNWASPVTSPQYIFNPIMNWWMIMVPGIFLVIFTIAVNLFGDGLRDVLDPKLRR